MNSTNQRPRTSIGSLVKSGLKAVKRKLTGKESRSQRSIPNQEESKEEVKQEIQNSKREESKEEEYAKPCQQYEGNINSQN